MQSQKCSEMRKFLLSLVSLVVFSALVGGMLSGCENEKKSSDTIDTTVVNPQQLMSSQQDGEGQGEMTITGTVVDGSQNMVIVETENGEDKEFNYNSDNYAPSDMYDWDLDDNNKIKVTYVEVKPGMDSVIRIEKAE